MTYDRELRTEAAHALTHNQEVWSDRGYAVVTAGGLSEGDTDFEVDVGPYDVLVGSTTQTSVGPTTLSVNAPDSDPYWLVVYVDGEGLQTEQGPEGEVFVGDQSVVASNADVREITSPAPPTLADIGPVTILGKVLVTSSGVTASLIDDRVFQSERVFESVDANEVTTGSADIGPAAKGSTADPWAEWIDVVNSTEGYEAVQQVEFTEVDANTSTTIVTEGAGDAGAIANKSIVLVRTGGGDYALDEIRHGSALGPDVNSTTRGTPGSRTYTNDGRDLQLEIGSAAAVSAVKIGLNAPIL